MFALDGNNIKKMFDRGGKEITNPIKEGSGSLEPSAGENGANRFFLYIKGRVQRVGHFIKNAVSFRCT